MGKDGCFWRSDPGRWGGYIPGERVNAVDTTGAGDAFHGAFLRALDLGFDVDAAIKFSSAVAAISCLSLGGRNGIPNLQSTLAFMEKNKIYQEG
jgi:sulfofructose kinase